MSEFIRFTDPTQMRSLLQRHLPGYRQKRLVISDCQVLHAHYYTSRKHRAKSWLGICYALAVQDQLTQTSGTQLLYGRARLAGHSHGEFAQAQHMALWPPHYGDPVVHLPEWDMTLWAFPNDPQLAHLPQVIDPQLVKAHLPYAMLPAGFASAAQLANLEVEVVHYYPEERCINRYRLWSSEPGQPQPLVIFGKTFRKGVGLSIYQRMESLWQQAQHDPALFTVTRPLAYAAAVQTLWQQFQPGCPLLKVLDAHNAGSLLARVAQGLVALQQRAFPDLSLITMTERMDELHDKAAKLIHAVPAWEGQIAHLLQRLGDGVGAGCAVQTTLLHGDFHPRQLLVDQGRIVCFDFDEFAWGDPLQDVASFMVDLQMSGFAAISAQQMALAFYRAYCDYAPWAAPPERLAWHLRYQLFTKAYRHYRQQRPGWASPAQALLEQAETGDWVCM